MKTLIALFLTTLSITAATVTIDPVTPAPGEQVIAPGAKITLRASADDFYKAGEVNVDAFVSTITHDFNKHRDGVGVGVAYFVTPHSGIRVDTFTSYLGGRSAVDALSASYVYRIPMGQSAPYGTVGADYSLEARNWAGHLGVGLEYRFVKNFGVFAEARMVKEWNDHSDPVGQGLAGVRLNF